LCTPFDRRATRATAPQIKLSAAPPNRIQIAHFCRIPDSRYQIPARWIPDTGYQVPVQIHSIAGFFALPLMMTMEAARKNQKQKQKKKKNSCRISHSYFTFSMIFFQFFFKNFFKKSKSNFNFCSLRCPSNKNEQFDVDVFASNDNSIINNINIIIKWYYNNNINKRYNISSNNNNELHNNNNNKSTTDHASNNNDANVHNPSDNIRVQVRRRLKRRRGSANDAAQLCPCLEHRAVPVRREHNERDESGVDCDGLVG
jgi:hypothetical protein